MDESVIAAFLVGAAAGAAAKFFNDRRLLRSYAELARQLSRALQVQMECGRTINAAARPQSGERLQKRVM